MKPVWTTMLLVMLTGCATPRVVRLDTAQGPPLVHIPRSGGEPVRLRADDFQEAMAELARDVRPTSRPLQHARALMFNEWRLEEYLEWTGRHLVPATPEREAPRLQPEPDEVTRGHVHWCEHRRRPSDCFSLLTKGPSLDAEGRYTLAMAIATEAVWSETQEALADMADPEAVRASIVSAMAMYMLLWVLPEPASKGLAATLTAALIAYLGVKTSLTPDDVETAIMSHLHTYRASGGSLPLSSNGAVPTPYMGQVTVRAHTVEFSAIQASNNTVFVGT